MLQFFFIWTNQNFISACLNSNTTRLARAHFIFGTGVRFWKSIWSIFEMLYTVYVYINRLATDFQLSILFQQWSRYFFFSFLSSPRPILFLVPCRLIIEIISYMYMKGTRFLGLEKRRFLERLQCCRTFIMLLLLILRIFHSESHVFADIFSFSISATSMLPLL